MTDDGWGAMPSVTEKMGSMSMSTNEVTSNDDWDNFGSSSKDFKSDANQNGFGQEDGGFGGGNGFGDDGGFGGGGSGDGGFRGRGRGGRGGRGRGRGGGRGGSNRDNNSDFSGFGGGGNDGGFKPRRNFGDDEDRPRGARPRDDDFGGDGSKEPGEEPEKPAPYIPQAALEGDEAIQERNEMYHGIGINFEKLVAEEIPVEVTIGEGGQVATAVKTFEELELRPLVLENIKKIGYKTPTPIQKHASPQLIEGYDVMACAQTGSGKTAAFLLPIINTLLVNQNDLDSSTHPVCPSAVVLAPTRELALQIGREGNLYAANSIIRVAVIYGGTATFAMRNRLQGGCHILVATPGRLKQFMGDDTISLKKVQFFILDEADRMLDMGFMSDVQMIVQQMPPAEERVSGMFSATFPTGVQKAATAFLRKNYVFVVIGMVGAANTDVSQEIMQLDRGEKRDKITEIIGALPTTEKVLVFCNTKKGADFLAASLCRRNLSVTSIHGDRLQHQREEALREFTTGRRQVLVATAVAARGLDIPKVGVVINYDLPNDIDEYVHRIGRTGRVGHTGRAISFFEMGGNDMQLAAQLVAILKGANQHVPDFLQGMDSGASLSFASSDMRPTPADITPNENLNNQEDDW